MKCPHCNNEKLRKRGSMKTKRGIVQRFECKACNKTFTQRTGSLNYRHRKQDLRTTITELYCEGMSLRAIARVLKIHRKTVTKYFLENAQVAKTKNLKTLLEGGIITTYAQFDELETFEHTKRRPLGVEASIRAKTGEIISMKVATIPVKSLKTSAEYKEKWNKQINRRIVLTDMLLETEQALNKDYAMVACDNAAQLIKIATNIFGSHRVQVINTRLSNKRIDYAFLKLRQDISRLRRRTLATTKKRESLQMHLDLYTDYHNTKRIA